MEAVTGASRLLMHTPNVELRAEPDGILTMVRRGEFTVEDVERFSEIVTPYFKAERPRIWIDAREAGKVSIEARRRLYELAKQSAATRVAVVGASAYARVVANLVLRIATRTQIRYFDDADKALAWLRA